MDLSSQTEFSVPILLIVLYYKIKTISRRYGRKSASLPTQSFFNTNPICKYYACDAILHIV